MTINQNKMYFVFITLLLFGCSIFSQSVFADSIDDFTLMTEQGPPYNYMEKDEIKGIAVDTLALILKRANSKLTKKDIKMMPWARAYNDTLNKARTCLFSTTRTEERENLFKWVGPFGVFKIVVMAKKSKHIKINAVEELNYYRIGVINQDVSEQILISMGVKEKQLDKVTSNIQNLKKMDSNRIDLWGYGENVAKWEIKRYGFNPDDYETVFVLLTKDLYYAFHKSTSDELIQKLQAFLDQIKLSGDHQKILDRYLK